MRVLTDVPKTPGLPRKGSDLTAKFLLIRLCTRQRSPTEHYERYAVPWPQTLHVDL